MAWSDRVARRVPVVDDRSALTGNVATDDAIEVITDIAGSIKSEQTGVARANKLNDDPRPRSRSDRDLQHPVALVREEIVGGLDIVQLEPVRHHRSQVDPTGRHDVHQPPHALFAAGA